MTSITLIACPHPIGYFYKRNDEQRLIKVPKGCGRWDCPYCGEKKKKKLLDRIARHFKAYPDECRMLTLTLAEDIDDTRITECWNRLKASLRKYGYKFAYVWFKEFTKNGRRHLHILLDKFIRKALIKRLWLKATDNTSYIVKINRRPIRSAAGYCSKYVTKDIQHEDRYLYKERRYTCSRDFNLPRLQRTADEWGFEYDNGAFLNIPQVSQITIAREKWNELRSKHRLEDSKQQPEIQRI